MRVSRLVSVTNWRYALGEVLLIVVGVTIALAATSWYEERQEQLDESLILRQLQQTLSEDLIYFNSEWETTRNRERNIMALLEHLDSDRAYSPELARNFQSLYGWRTVRIRTAPFEALKVQGYKSISSALLRQKLISFYEDYYARLEYSSIVDRDFVVQKVQPYFLKNFILRESDLKDVDGGTQDWAPKDYDQIRTEQYVANLSRFRADILRRFDLRHYETTTVALQEILDLIEQELADDR